MEFVYTNGTIILHNGMYAQSIVWFEPPINVRLGQISLEGSMNRPVDFFIDPKCTRQQLLDYSLDQFGANKDKYGHV